MTDTPDEEADDIPGMIEEVWDGEGLWIGDRVLVARSPGPDGDVILTLPPQAFTGTWDDGSQDVVIPLALLRWVLAGDQRDSYPA